jgi:ribosomal protein L16 Arg81 hydroxylase
MQALTGQGFPAAAAVSFCARLYDDPAFEAGQWMAQQLHKVQSVLTMRERMAGLSAARAGKGIDRRQGLSSEEFLEEYYSTNTPVVLPDSCDRWAAQELWNPRYLAEKLGRVEVEVMADRDADPDYEVNSDHHKLKMRFDEYVAMVESGNRSNDRYLVANNQLALWEDFELDDRLLVPDPDHTQAFLWFGPAGTITPLHHDTINVLFNQVTGRKHFILIPSLAVHRVYNNKAVYSEVDPLAPDLDRHPMYAEVRPIHLEVGPGESLFIPAGWWHHVEALDTSVSVSFTNFRFDNSIEWQHPG